MGPGIAAAVFWSTGCPFPCDRLADAKFGEQPHTSRPGMCGSSP